MGIYIRKEESKDIQDIHALTIAAFLNAPHTDHTEQFVVKALRNSNALSISLVADSDGDIVGHLALSPVIISDGSKNWYGLGPISVHPNEQSKGIGTRLINTAIDELKALRANGCVLLGDPNYYRRFGFEPKEELKLPDVPPEYFQSLLINGDCPQGTVSYHESFSAKN